MKPIETSFKRIETKYVVAKGDLANLIEDLKIYLVEDDYPTSTISNIYFDTEQFDMIQEDGQGTKRKEKIRMRTYLSQVQPDSQVFLEIKSKDRAGVGRKHRLLSTPQSITQFMTKGQLDSSIKDRMIIEKIQKNKLYLSTGEIMDVSPLIRQKYSLKVNDNIEGLYDEISYEASLEKGIFLLSLRDRTKKELQQKLNEKYRNSRMIEKSVSKLVELGYINDKDYAVSYIMSRKYGKQRIAYNLMQKGIGRETIEEAYFSIEEEYERNIEDEKLEKAIEKNIKKEENKLIQYLVRQGFSLNKILSKYKEFKENNDMEGE